MLPLFIPLTVTVLVAQLCPILCDPVDYSSPPLLSMEFSWQEYWSEFPYPSPGHLPDPGIELRSPAFQTNSLLSETPGLHFLKF